MSLDDRTHEGYRRMLRYELQRPARTQALPPPPSVPPSAVHLRLKAARRPQRGLATLQPRVAIDRRSARAVQQLTASRSLPELALHRAGPEHALHRAAPAPAAAATDAWPDEPPSIPGVRGRHLPSGR